LMPSPGAAPLTGDATQGGAEGGASVPPANLNQKLPEAWFPFVDKEQSTGTIQSVKPGKKSDAQYVLLDSGAIAGTSQPDLIARAIALHAEGAPVVLVTQPHKKLGAEIISITAAADVQL